MTLVAETKCAVIEGLEREWRDALCSKDMDRLQSLVHKDFVLIGTRSTGPFMMTPRGMARRDPAPRRRSRSRSKCRTRPFSKT